MKNVEFWRWMIADEWGRRHKSVCLFTEAEALSRDPEAERVPGTLELRQCPEPDDLRRWSSRAFAGYAPDEGRAGGEGRPAPARSAP